MAAFLIGDALETSWSVVRKNFWLCCGCGLGVLFVPCVSAGIVGGFVNALTNSQANSWPLFTMLLNLAIFVLQSGLQVGICYTALKLLDTGKADLFDLLSCIRKVPSYLIATFIFTIVVSIACWFLLIPGVYLTMKLGFYPFAIVDKEMGPIEALKYSYAITKGSTWKVFGLLVMMILILVAGLLCLVVGLIPAGALCVLAVAFTYRQLTTDKGELVP